MSEPAATVGAVDELTGAPLGERDQLGKRRDAEPGGGRDEHRCAAEEADRRKVARDLDRQVGGGACWRHEGRERGNKQRVTIGRRAPRKPNRNRAAGAGLIDREHLLSPDLREPVGDDAQDHVDGAAGRRVGDDLDRPGGKVLRRGGHCCDQRQAEAGDDTVNAHVVLPSLLVVCASFRRVCAQYLASHVLAHLTL